MKSLKSIYASSELRPFSEEFLLYTIVELDSATTELFG